MPIYEYECSKCHAHSEVMQKMTDKPLKKCRECGGRLEKQWSPTSFQLKGSGWYMTDYAAKKAETKEESKETKEAGNKPDAKEEKSTKEEKSAKSDSEPASDKATKPETSTSKKKSSSKPAPSSGD
jgi:putative FmdB family regulatory protein